MAPVVPGHSAQRKRSRGPNDDAGFTLLEVLVVVAILGMLIGLVAPTAMRQLGTARTAIGKQAVERLGGLLDLYKLDIGSYPNTEQGLQALVERPAGTPSWNGPYIKGDVVPLDAWNRPYTYRTPSTRRGYDYDLCSAGPNNVTADPATEGAICNR